MAAKRVARSAVNWSELYSKCPKHQLEQFRELKTKSDNLISRISSLPESLPKINWDHYSHAITIPGLVDKFNKEYHSIAVDFPKDTSGAFEKVRVQGKTMVDNANRHAEACRKLKASAEKMKSAVNNLPPPEELVPELVMVYFPLTNIDPFGAKKSEHTDDKTILEKAAPPMHWDFS